MRRWRERPNRRRVAHLWNQSGGDSIQPAHGDQHDQRERLGLAWSYDVDRAAAARKPRRSSPTDAIYGITNWSIVFAVDARTGKEKWRWDRR